MSYLIQPATLFCPFLMLYSAQHVQTPCLLSKAPYYPLIEATSLHIMVLNNRHLKFIETSI